MSDKRKTRDAPRARWWRLAVAAGLVAAVGCGLSLWPRFVHVGPRSHWLLQAMAGRMFIACAVVLIGCGFLFAAVAAWLWQTGRRYRVANRGEQGAAIIEFTLAMPILLFLGLLMAQASLLMVGNLCVHYAAFCSARSAIVVIPKDYGAAEPKNLLLDSDETTGKMYRIKLAAFTALLPVSCDSPDVEPAGAGGDVYIKGVQTFLSLQGVNQPVWVDERLSRKLSYAAAYTKVTVDPPEPKTDPGNEKDGYFDDNEDVHVHLTHTFYLSVPIASRIFSLVSGGVDLPFGDGEYGTNITAEYTLPNEGVQDYVDIETFPKDAR